jgi:hypothetical protein
MKKHKFKPIGSNSIDGATTTNATWGFKPVPNKGGKTANATISNKEGNKNA